MSENMMNANRPVTTADIAAKLGMSVKTVKTYLHPGYSKTFKGVEVVRQTAKEMGYTFKGEQTICADCGNTYTKSDTKQLFCPKCKTLRHRERTRKTRESSVVGGFYGGNFATKEEETARMEELRNMGYSNNEIAVKIGKSRWSVWHRIGKQDPELSKQNVAMAVKFRAQKNAARKQYVVNKPIREYNRKVEEHNALKAKVAQMEAELKPQAPAIKKVAQIQINFPMVDLHTVQPTQLN